MMMPKDNKTRNGSGDKGIKTVLIVIVKRDIGNGMTKLKIMMIGRRIGSKK